MCRNVHTFCGILHNFAYFYILFVKILHFSCSSISNFTCVKFYTIFLHNYRIQNWVCLCWSLVGARTLSSVVVQHATWPPLVMEAWYPRLAVMCFLKHHKIMNLNLPASCLCWMKIHNVIKTRNNVLFLMKKGKSHYDY